MFKEEVNHSKEGFGNSKMTRTLLKHKGEIEAKG